MSSTSTISSLLETLTQSLDSSRDVGPRLASIKNPEDGVSLLQVKNELLLSYLQNLVFFILLKIRQCRDGETEGLTQLNQSVVKNLAGLRLYLEKGTRPLEDKMRYQLEMLLRATEEMVEGEKPGVKKAPGLAGSESSSEGDVDGSSDDDQEEDEVDSASEDEALHRPIGRLSKLKEPVVAATDKAEEDSHGAYRPPKRERVVMEPSETRTKRERRPHNSATVDEFVASELSTAPLAEPSIGTNVLDGGRKVKTASERRVDAERRDYEESNFVRLPKESKKEKAKKAKASGRSGRMDFGGEEWRELGNRVDRIDRLTKRKEAKTGVKAMLEKSRKRGASARDDVQMGERFQKRVKLLEGGRRDRGSKRR